MRINLAIFVFAVFALQHMAHGKFMSDCESGVIDFGKEFMIHLEDNFPEVTKSASREMSKIYSNVLKLVSNKEEEDDLQAIHDAIAAYLKACNQFLNLNATLTGSMGTIDAEMANMRVAEVCQKPTDKARAYRDILKSTFVSKILSLDYFSTIVAGGSKALYTIAKSAYCLLTRECTDGLKKIVKESIADMRDLATSFLGEILVDIQDALQHLFKGHFVKLKCKVNKGFKESCEVLDNELASIKRKLDRQLRNYQVCLDNKSGAAQKITNLGLMKVLLTT